MAAGQAPTSGELEQALRTIDTAIEEKGSLRSRTEGLTWMIWGFVAAGVVLSFDALAWMYQGATPATLSTWAWIPWVLVGAGATGVLWRSAAASAPRLRHRPQGGLVVTLAYVGVMVVTWGAASFLLGGAHPDTLGMLAIASAWLFVAGLRPFGVTERGRRVAGAIGVGIAATGLACSAFLPSDPVLVNRYATFASLAASGGLPLAMGAWQALRG